MAQPVSGYLGYDPVSDRPLVKLKSGTKKLLTEDDSSGGGSGPHHESHQVGGSDEINISGLHGELADPQPPLPHKISHENGGSDPISTLGVLTADAFLQVPTSITYAANVTLNAAVKNDYVIGTLTGPCAITWSNPAAGRQGSVVVRQDATGNRAVTLTAPAGWTLMRDSQLGDLAAAVAANAITLYTWSFLSVGGVNVLLCSKVIAA